MKSTQTKRTFRDSTELIQSWLEELNSQTNMSAIKRKLNQFRNDFEWEVEDSGPTGKRGGHRQYDKLIEKLFNETSSAISKEGLLELFLNELDQQELCSQVLTAFVIEAVKVDEKTEQYEYYGVSQRRLHEKHWQNFKRNVLPNCCSNNFLNKTIIQRQSIELWHSDYLEGYNGEFNSFVSSPQKSADHPQNHRSFWLSAIPLPSNSNRHPSRGLFLIYPAHGEESYRTVPAGANQELRCLHFLGIAYQQLEHQLRNVAEQVSQQRSTLLNSLAPGLLHHEIGHQIWAISDIVQLQRSVLKRLLENTTGQDLERQV